MSLRELASTFEPSRLPINWALATIGDLIGQDGIFIDGDWIETKDQDPTGNVRLVQLADVGDGVFRNRSTRFLTLAKADELGCTFLKPGDVLIARMPDPLGRACIFPGDPKTSITAVDVCIVRTGTNGADHRWLMNTINSSNVRSTIASLQSGSTRKRISRGNLAKIEIPVPPLPEQHRIVAKIEELYSDLDAGVAALQNAKQQLKRYRQAVLKAAVEGKLTAEWRAAHKNEIEPASVLLERIRAERAKKANGKMKELPQVNAAEVGELPEGWVWTTIQEIGEVSGGLTKNQNRNSIALKMPYLRVANVYAARLELEDIVSMGVYENEIERTLLERGDLLVVEGNGSPEQIGRVALWNGAISPCLHQNHIIKVRFDQVRIGDFVLYWLLSIDGRGYITKNASSTSGLYTLSISKVSSLPVPIPPIEEQQQIVSEVERRLSVVDEIEKTVVASLKQAERLRQSILKKAFAGKLVPQDPTDEPAEKLLERIQVKKLSNLEPPGKRKKTGKPNKETPRLLPLAFDAKGE